MLHLSSDIMLKNKYYKELEYCKSVLSQGSTHLRGAKKKNK